MNMVTVNLTADVPDGRTFADPEFYIVTTNTDTKHIIFRNEFESTNITVEGNAEATLSVTPFYTCRQEDNMVLSWSIKCLNDGNNSILYYSDIGVIMIGCGWCVRTTLHFVV